MNKIIIKYINIKFTYLYFVIDIVRFSHATYLTGILIQITIPTPYVWLSVDIF